RKTKPHYCFNMHDQRTIFSVGEENSPATISFLAPSVDKKRTLTDGRKQTMEVIVSMNNLLQKFIPNQIGRYTDEFYPTATGDNFQKMGHNTILVESGHFKNDYQREKTRKYTFFALLEGLSHIAFREKASNYEDYFKIPNNEKLYLDVILVDVIYEKNKIDIGILFEEILKDKQLHFIPKVKIKGDLSNYNANRIVNDLSFPNENKLKKWLKNEFN
ncbi:MAG: peptidase M14, partial [Flavobacteriaceae bacterium]|nr:peptidase M14 [Flavobacteriaceae bacterium]